MSEGMIMARRQNKKRESFRRPWSSGRTAQMIRLMMEPSIDKSFNRFLRALSACETPK
jgi:hypothetical protein